MGKEQQNQVQTSATTKNVKQMSLMEKWEEHKKTGKADVNAKNIMANIAPFWFLFTLFWWFLIGAHQLLFIIYDGWSRNFIFWHQVFCYILFAEMLMNWLCLRYVTSDYTSELAESSQHLKFVVTESEIKEKMLAQGMEFGRKDNHSVSDNNGAAKDDRVRRGAVKRHLSHLFANKKKECASKSDGVSKGTETSERHAYWSWRPCAICKMYRPPRVMHCPICNKCQLKRDHHCYFSGTCVALFNQRHFIVFSFWCCVATVYSIVHAVVLFYIDVIPKTSWWDVILPVTCFRWLLGYTGLYYLIVIALVYSIVWFCPITMYFFLDHITVVTRGITSFEYEKSTKLTSTRTQYDNFKSVFGKFWFINFIIPIHFIYKPVPNGIEYPDIKVWYLDK